MKPQMRSMIALTWAQRAQAERGAEARFKLLSEQLGDLHGGSNVIAMAKKAERDEARHSVLCSNVAREMGHKTGFAMIQEINVATPPPPKSWTSEIHGEQDRLLCEVTLMCCITETINASDH